MAIDLAKSKIRVNEVAPGMIETSGSMEIENIVSEDAIHEDKKKYPLGIYGQPEDVALACVYLLSDASKWVTGSKIIIDGGFTAQ
jgi:NAD(P)-dependent dehydrogenase (short-subunit alcohol dehydrogenase family)